MWPSRYSLLLCAALLLGCFLLLLVPGSACAATSDSELRTSHTLMGAWYTGVLGNQRRMIQVTLVCLVIGIFFLSWGKK